jgi:cell wall-associated NlpC family hydrolase
MQNAAIPCTWLARTAGRILLNVRLEHHSLSQLEPRDRQDRTLKSTRIHWLIAALACGIAAGAAAAEGTALPIPAHGVIGVDAPQMTADFWIARLSQPDRVIFDPGAIAERNAKLVRVDPTMHDLRALPATLSRAQVTQWIEAMSERPTRQLFAADGKPVTSQTLDGLVDAIALAAIPEQEPTRYGLVVHRADLRTFPTALRVFSRSDDHDIDRFQESALFPGTPVVLAHASKDGQWWFVVSPRYAAWVEKKHIAEGTAAQVLDYVDKKPFRIVTGATAATVTTPEQPSVSTLRLDMGTRVPLLNDWPAANAVNGQHPYSSYVIELPVRSDAGQLKLVPALLQKNTDTQSDYLPLTRANILRQAFKFLGERYGWGHSYDARDCSGFVSDVYSSMGVRMPRNTRDQSVSPGLDHRLFGEADDRAVRLAAVGALEVGDLVYIPGHVMMAIGSIDGVPYVIHDTTGASYRQPDGSKARVTLNEVSVTPLTPLLFNDTQTYVDRMTSIVRIRPDSDSKASAQQ